MSSKASRNEGWENRTAGKTEPPWFADELSLRFHKLDKDITAEIVIVGGGIAGITTAYLLCKAGRDVALIEDGDLCSGETGRTTAHITNALDDRYYNIEKMHGRQGAKLAAESHTAAIDMIEEIVDTENINCNFERLDGYLFSHPTDSHATLEKELVATHRAGIEQTELLRRAPLNSFDTGICLHFPNQAQFQPLKYLAGLAQAIFRKGGSIYTRTHAQQVTPTRVITSEGYKVVARKVILATNAPIVDDISKIYNKQSACRTYVIAASIGKGSIPKALYWDTGNQRSRNPVSAYHYIRIQEMDSPFHDLLIVGGEDHAMDEDADAEKRFAALEAWTRKRFRISGIEYRWSGQVLEPKDSLAFIGRNQRGKGKNVYIATGDSGNGMTHGTIAGMLLTDLVLRKGNRWAKLYNPSRRIRPIHKRAGSSSPVVRRRKKQKKLSRGEGTVLEMKAPLAVYRDDEGMLHSYSARCTHLGCTLKWNDSEKSFDCPCHGSRYSALGQVVNGPANENLVVQSEEK